MSSDHLSGVDLNLLPSLAALLRTRSVTRAAREVGVTQSAMSRTLGRLRALFDDPLLVRSGRSLTATPRAEALVGPLRRLLDDADALLRAQRPFEPASAELELVLSLADYGTLLLLPPLLRRLGRDAPGVEVVTEAVAEETPARLASGAVTVAISPRLPDVAGLRRGPGAAQRFSCLLRADHPAIRGDGTLPLDAWAGLRHLLVAPGGRPGGVVDEVLARHGLTRRVAARVRAFGVVGEIIAGTDLVATIPAGLATRFTSVLPVRAVAPPVEVPGFALHAFWHERYATDAAHRWLRGVVVETLAEASLALSPGGAER